MSLLATNVQALIDAKLTGEITHNSAAINQQAIREVIARNPYWAYQSRLIEQLTIDLDEAIQIVASALGLSVAEFTAEGPATINPRQTASQLTLALRTLDQAARDGARILLATGHPGSLLEPYARLAQRLERLGAEIYRLDAPIVIKDHYHLDQVSGVAVLTDQGSLQHTHNPESLPALLHRARPDWVVADHGFALAAIDADIATVALFDTDDAAVPLAATLRDTVIPVPINDNQTNTLTAAALGRFAEAIDGD